MENLRFLLLQIRDPDDLMRPQEVGCFARAIGCQLQAITPFDLLKGFPDQETLESYDAVLIGGSGQYSAAEENAWLDDTLAGFRRLVAMRKHTFASCWGFQAIARAMGGRCIHDPAHAELGTIEFHLTKAGQRDPLFGELNNPFLGQAGHQDHVVELPPGAILLACSARVANQAFKFADAPIYCTQFHPELDLDSFLGRVETYPQYVEHIAGVAVEEFCHTCRDTPETRELLRRFAQAVAQSLDR